MGVPLVPMHCAEVRNTIQGVASAQALIWDSVSVFLGGSLLLLSEVDSLPLEYMQQCL